MHNTILIFLAIGGLLASVLSILEKHIKWILSFCDIFGEGCRKALKFQLFGIPVSWYGLAYYVFLVFLIYLMEPWIFWYVMAGFGIELTFVWIMIYIRAFCIFCTINAVMMTGLFILVFDPGRIWESLPIVLIFFMGSLFFLYRENVSEFKGTTKTDDESIAARINGDVITIKEVEQPLTQKIYRLRSQIYQLKKARLEKLIRELLIKKQAKLTGMSEKELINTILEDKFKDFDGELENGKKEETIIEYADSLRKNFEVKVFLRAPRLPAINVPIKDDPSLGHPDAPVVVVEFSDYLCPGCRKAHENAEIVKEKYRDRIRWVFKDFPLEQHKGADKMAEAAHCADEQGKFWPYQDLLFSSKFEPRMEKLEKFAESLGMDKKKFRQCVESRKYKSKVEESVKIGKEAGVSATPTFIINGQMISGAPSPAKFEEIIEKALEKATSSI
ncbi:MAG: thioredoxin domain-containing protein [Desulfobacterales bacterium]